MNNNHSILCVTASGCLESDCEVRNDKSGNKYIQFKMVCSTKDMAGQTLYIPFRCFTYNVKYAKLKKGWKSPVCVTPEAQVPLTLESKFRMTPIKS